MTVYAARIYLYIHTIHKYKYISIDIDVIRERDTCMTLDRNITPGSIVTAFAEITKLCSFVFEKK